MGAFWKERARTWHLVEILPSPFRWFFSRAEIGFPHGNCLTARGTRKWQLVCVVLFWVFFVCCGLLLVLLFYYYLLFFPHMIAIDWLCFPGKVSSDWKYLYNISTALSSIMEWLHATVIPSARLKQSLLGKWGNKELL